MRTILNYQPTTVKIAASRGRTRNILITNQVLYQLSYSSERWEIGDSHPFVCGIARVIPASIHSLAASILWHFSRDKYVHVSVIKDSLIIR